MLKNLISDQRPFRSVLKYTVSRETVVKDKILLSKTTLCCPSGSNYPFHNKMSIHQTNQSHLDLSCIRKDILIYFRKSSPAKMVDVASVPLMDDMEGDEGMGRKDMEGGGLESDFSYNNNVAGASKHIRLGIEIQQWK